jgi:hypothetical protein
LLLIPGTNILDFRHLEYVVAGTSGPEVISLQKVDSLLVFLNVRGELKGFVVPRVPAEKPSRFGLDVNQ